MNETEAIAYIRNHDADVRRWDRKPKYELVRLVLDRMRAMNILLVTGGPARWSKDELVNWLANDRYPDAQDARSIYYAAAGAR